MPCHSQLNEAGIERFANLIKNLLTDDDYDDDELLSISQFISRRTCGGKMLLNDYCDYDGD